ncbi:MAG: 50S ribosomal protein L21 [Chloroflexota bacterium]
MRYAIVESGGKQYKAVEGETIEVDRLPANVGEKLDLSRVLMLVDGEMFSVGTPTVSDMQVSATVVEHFKGPKVVFFKYSPKKRIRVKGGHRQQYTRLMVDVIGKPGESRKPAKAEKVEAPAVVEAEAKAEKPASKAKAEKASQPKATKAEKAPAKAPAKGKKESTDKKPSAPSKTAKK